MKVRSPSTGSSNTVQTAAGAEPNAVSDARVRGQKLLELASERPLVPASLLGVSQASLDALSRALLEGAVLVAERRSKAD